MIGEKHHRGLILITGATGYIGGRILNALTRRGERIRCMARHTENLRSRVPESVEVVRGDVFDPKSLDTALVGVQIAYYNVHSLAGNHDFEDSDRLGAEQFGAACLRAGVERIIYLGGLGREKLSRHLASRQEVGRILAASGVSCIEIRASIVIGSGSLSFEMARALAERLPVMTTPRWVRTLAQPIAIEDVVSYLVAALEYESVGHEIFEVGGADQISYEGIMRTYCEIRRLKRLIIPVPLLTPGLSSRWLALVTPLYAGIGRWLIDGVKNETIVTDRRAEEIFQIKPMGIKQAIERALENEDLETAETRWSDSLGPYESAPQRRGRRHGSRLVYSRSIYVPVPPEETFLPIQYIGGTTGWYSHSWMWTLRGIADKLVGGAGRNRGRRDPVILLPGDAVDFWRVEEIAQYRMLRLRSEMKLPGRGWLQFETEPIHQHDGSIGTNLSVHAIFDPIGLRGLLYWYVLYPFHGLVFKRMLKTIYRAAYHSPE